jgi:hypothetical protein
LREPLTSTDPPVDEVVTESATNVQGEAERSIMMERVRGIIDDLPQEQQRSLPAYLPGRLANCGSFLSRPDAAGNGSLVLPSIPPGIKAKAFGVTLEDAAGSKTPTAPILLAGSVPENRG